MEPQIDRIPSLRRYYQPVCRADQPCISFSSFMQCEPTSPTAPLPESHDVFRSRRSIRIVTNVTRARCLKSEHCVDPRRPSGCQTPPCSFPPLTMYSYEKVNRDDDSDQGLLAEDSERVAPQPRVSRFPSWTNALLLLGLLFSLSLNVGWFVFQKGHNVPIQDLDPDAAMAKQRSPYSTYLSQRSLYGVSSNIVSNDQPVSHGILTSLTPTTPSILARTRPMRMRCGRA